MNGLYDDRMETTATPPETPTDESAAGDSAAGASTVGMLGFGNMGLPAARHLLAAARSAGVPFLVHARRPASVAELVEGGARSVPTPAGLAAADVVLSLLPDLVDLEPLLWGESGIVSAVRAPLTLLIASTSSPGGVRELAARLHAATGGLVDVVDCPVSGGAEGARDARLVIMVGGEDAAVDRALPVLGHLGTPTHLGPLGSGEVAKACNQAIVAATISAIAEAAVLADRSGLDVAGLFSVLGGGYAGSRILETRGERVASGAYGADGPAKYMVKDLRFALDEARRTGAELPLTSLLSDTFVRLVDGGFGDQDISVVRAFVESLAPSDAPS